MSIHAHAAPHIDWEGRSRIASLSVWNRRQVAFADMSETAGRGTVAALTVSDPRGHFTGSSLELSIAIAFDGCGEPSR